MVESDIVEGSFVNGSLSAHKGQCCGPDITDV